MDDLVQWLGEQLDEDERIARATLWDDEGALGSGGWYAYDRGPRDGFREARWVVIDRADEGVMDSRPQAADDQAVARHIAEHDPARVLREIDAKRQVIALYTAILSDRSTLRARMCQVINSDSDEFGRLHLQEGKLIEQERHLRPVVRLLVLPYADRSGYREEWRP